LEKIEQTPKKDDPAKRSKLDFGNFIDALETRPQGKLAKVTTSEAKEIVCMWLTVLTDVFSEKMFRPRIFSNVADGLKFYDELMYESTAFELKITEDEQLRFTLVARDELLKLVAQYKPKVIFKRMTSIMGDFIFEYRTASILLEVLETTLKELD